jgi:leucyl-tRNA synthetase
VVDPQYLVADEIEIAVQVNGKMRASIRIPAEADAATAIALAKASDNVARHLDGLTIRREIYVPGRIVNLVVG